jgi:hypothetical protein
MVACLIVWCIWTAWQTDDDGEVFHIPSVVLNHTCQRIFASVKHFTVRVRLHFIHPTPHAPEEISTTLPTTERQVTGAVWVPM